MEFGEDFRKLGSLTIETLREKILSLSEDDWCLDEKRQVVSPAHKQTKSIKLLFDEFSHENPVPTPYLTAFKEEVVECSRAICKYYDSQLKYKRLKRKNEKGFFIRILLTRLEPGGEIPLHRDRGKSLRACHRIHIPVITNENVIFIVGGTEKILEAGEIWEINNRREHSVYNRSSKSRVHLIMDYVIPGEKITDFEGELVC